MVVDAVRTYLDAANGLTELSRKEAVAAAKALLRADGAQAPVVPATEAAQGPPPRVGQNIQALAGELIETSQANRSAIADLVRAEVGRALEQMDMVPRGEYERVVRRVVELERRMAARHAVERVLAPRGGASSALPAVAEHAEPTAETDTDSAPVKAQTPATSASARAEAEVEPAPQESAAPESEDREDTAKDATETEIAPEAVEDTGTADDTTDEDEGEDTSTETARGERSTSRSKSKTGPKSTAKSTRPRPAAKRTTKGKSTKK
ncbi:membrane fusogenic activity family protein [Nocardiopsis sp. MG754419]|uniref:membrane fusogenic activity family protein n=1 Tax=Nocardiopsis sp. MG754419 TaxID=2259865 RepID=UPI001BA45B3A|nr:membrane fusogenic activity family protein [Nocardiopsis sp. MG754419]MBR8742748.1 membrane fusogenic activity family protein [Nocardiopsis sp. MG754419]